MNLFKAVKMLQARVRGFLQKKRYKALRIEASYAQNQFKSEEFNETVAARINSEGKKGIYKKYTYKCTKAVYEGLWNGNFRDGYGIMMWLDGARYEGNWKMGMARGNGKFYDVLGNVYEGNWVYSQRNGVGVFKSTNGS